MLRKQHGFTLIEILIVVSIVGILASLAFTTYYGSAQKSRRGDATKTLLHKATLQERWYIRENMYTPDINDLSGPDTSEGYYTISVANEIDGAVCADQLCFTLTALPVPAQPQIHDAPCQRFTIDSLGRKRAFDSANVENPRCWR